MCYTDIAVERAAFAVRWGKTHSAAVFFMYVCIFYISMTLVLLPILAKNILSLQACLSLNLKQIGLLKN